MFNKNLPKDEKENDLLERENYRNSENNLKIPKGVVNLRNLGIPIVCVFWENVNRAGYEGR
jgi:hypothetical protein